MENVMLPVAIGKVQLENFTFKKDEPDELRQVASKVCSRQF